MPYIKKDDRPSLDTFIDELNACLDVMEDHPGNLNYVITRLLQSFVTGNGGNYAAFNAAVGVLECAKLEHYRRWIGPYEDIKIQENGDV